MGRLVLHEHGQRDRRNDEQAGQPGGRFGQQVGSGPRSEGRLRTLSAERGGQIGAFALLQQDDDDEWW
jgi:hypothetical protein